MSSRNAFATNATATAPNDIFDPTLCETWSLIAPGEPCPTCADQHDEALAKAEAEARFRSGRPTFDLAR